MIKKLILLTLVSLNIYGDNCCCNFDNDRKTAFNKINQLVAPAIANINEINNQLAIINCLIDNRIDKFRDDKKECEGEVYKSNIKNFYLSYINETIIEIRGNIYKHQIAILDKEIIELKQINHLIDKLLKLKN